MHQNNTDKTFMFASSLVKIIAFIIALAVLVVSRYAFIFFAAAMLPAIFSIFFDANSHRCLSETICSFNLIGVMPSLIRIWQSNSIDHSAKQFIASLGTWIIIYGAAFIGQLLYTTIPLLIIKLYSVRIRLRVEKVEQQRKEICVLWGIKFK